MLTRHFRSLLTVYPVPAPDAVRLRSGRKSRGPKQCLMPHRPSLCPTQRLRQRHSLATALISVHAQFADDLVYRPGSVSREMNNPTLEPQGVQELTPDDLQVLAWSKEMTRQGWGTPLVVKWDSEQGWVVEADGPIPDWSLIAEYAGDVETVADVQLACSASNAMMALLCSGDASRDLVICPERHANAVRFVSGINNSVRESRKKINCRCVRFNIGGEMRALLIAIRHIAKGERLYYDYNGLEQAYPTHNFL